MTQQEFGWRGAFAVGLRSESIALDVGEDLTPAGVGERAR
jgi:hypothetical protein